MVVIKITLKSEIRRFSVEDPQRVDVFVLCKEHFPELLSKEFVLTYVDDEGDTCTLTPSSSPDEWREALNFINSTNVLRLSVRLLDSAGQDQPVHHAICDVCNTQISGIRYKCLVCPDFDLCATCESADEGHTSVHTFAKLRRPCSGGRGGPFRFCRRSAPEAAAADGGAAPKAGGEGEGDGCCKARGWQQQGHCGGRGRRGWWRLAWGGPADAHAAAAAAAAAAPAETASCDGAAEAARAFGLPTEWLGRAQEMLASGVPLPELIAAFLHADPTTGDSPAAAPAAAAAESAAAAAAPRAAATAAEPAATRADEASPRNEQPTEDTAAPSSARTAPEEPAAAPAATAPPATGGVPPFMQFLQNLNTTGMSLPELAASFLGMARPDAAAAPSAPDSPELTQALDTLAAMGFADDAERRRHRALLARYHLNVDRVVAELLSSQ